MSKVEKKKGFEIEFDTKTAVFHQAILISGKTENRITRQKIPTIEAMGWNKELTAFAISTGKETHVYPAAALADSILE